jgi:hypothetical protein
MTKAFSNDINRSLTLDIVVTDYGLIILGRLRARGGRFSPPTNHGMMPMERAKMEV